METIRLSAIVTPGADLDALAGAALAVGLAIESVTPITATVAATPASFAALFGHEPRRVAARPAGQDTYSPPGYAPDELTVPAALAPWLEGIGVEVPAVRLARGVFH
jgi:hypothetical protein